MARRRLSAEEKYQVLQAYEEGPSSIQEIVEQYGINISTFQEHIR